MWEKYFLKNPSLERNLFHLSTVEAAHWNILKIPLKNKRTMSNITRKSCWRNSWVFSPAGNSYFYSLWVEDPDAVCKPKTSHTAHSPCGRHCAIPHLLAPQGEKCTLQVGDRVKTTGLTRPAALDAWMLSRHEKFSSTVTCRWTGFISRHTPEILLYLHCFMA